MFLKINNTVVEAQSEIKIITDGKDAISCVTVIKIKNTLSNRILCRKQIVEIDFSARKQLKNNETTRYYVGDTPKDSKHITLIEV